MLDFDDNHTWEPGLTAAVGELLTKRLLRFQKQLAKYSLLVIDELGFA